MATTATTAGGAPRGDYAAVDHVSLDELSAGAGPNSKKGRGRSCPRGGFAGAKALIMLFLLFVFVVSDIFVDNILAGFRGATKCRTPSPYGVVLQGIFLVIFYVVVLHLADVGVV